MRLFTFILTINSAICFGQDFFLDNLKSSAWVSDERLDIEKIRSKKVIQLSKLRIAKDSLKVNGALWTFKDDIATVKHYDSKQKQENPVLTCKYNYDSQKGLLSFELNGNERLTYNFAIVSTGSFILLTREKQK